MPDSTGKLQCYTDSNAYNTLGMIDLWLTSGELISNLQLVTSFTLSPEHTVHRHTFWQII